METPGFAAGRESFALRWSLSAWWPSVPSTGLSAPGQRWCSPIGWQFVRRHRAANSEFVYQLVYHQTFGTW